MAQLLDDAAVTAALDALPGWTRDGDALVRTAKLSSFLEGIAVVVRVARTAEDRDHHPDIDIRWRTLTFRCSTHSKGGITDLDVALAASINDEIAAGEGPS
jgi:4a-hydroxytetrahydrobiopterin dehydratase